MPAKAVVTQQKLCNKEQGRKDDVITLYKSNGETTGPWFLDSVVHFPFSEVKPWTIHNYRAPLPLLAWVVTQRPQVLFTSLLRFLHVYQPLCKTDIKLSRPSVHDNPSIPPSFPNILDQSCQVLLKGAGSGGAGGFYVFIVLISTKKKL